MAIESYDESQGKPIEKLEETMILDDQTSYFLTTLEDVTRKINLINIAKALSGDEEGENSEFKFYTTKAIQEKFIQVNADISNVEGLYEQYDKILENLRTNVDTSLKKLELIVDNIDPKIREMYNKIVKEFESKFNDLAKVDNNLLIKIEDVYAELSDADKEIIKRFDTKFNELAGMVDQSGDLADSLFNIVNQDIENLRTRVNEIYTELKSQDAALLNKINELTKQTETNTGQFKSYYDQTQIDKMLQEIYNKFQVAIVSSNLDWAGRANNFNNYVNSGIYFFTQSANASNMPSGCTNGILHVINCGNGIIKQIFYRYGTLNSTDHQMYVRTFGSNIWTDWVRMLTTKDILIGTAVPSSLEDGQVYIQYFN